MVVLEMRCEISDDRGGAHRKMKFTKKNEPHPPPPHHRNPPKMVPRTLVVKKGIYIVVVCMCMYVHYILLYHVAEYYS